MPGEVTVSGRRGNVVLRWYLPIGDAWIAQFTIDSPPDVDPEAFVASVLESLTTSNEPRCYEGPAAASSVWSEAGRTADRRLRGARRTPTPLRALDPETLGPHLARHSPSLSVTGSMRAVGVLPTSCSLL